MSQCELLSILVVPAG